MKTSLQIVAPRALATAAFVIALCASAPLALASGGGGGGGGGVETTPTRPPGQHDNRSDLTTCDRGKVWDAKNRKCITKHSGVLPDDALTEYAYALAKAERYDEAIETLDQLQDPNTPRALNYRGYATRKMGHTEEGIGYYLQSVALDPHYAQVREYLGEAYVIQGKIDLAKQQLDTIGGICGSTDCEEYQDLAEAIHQAQGT
jgi:tetratricopeptide (TPR) repeat protein